MRVRDLVACRKMWSEVLVFLDNNTRIVRHTGGDSLGSKDPGAGSIAKTNVMQQREKLMNTDNTIQIKM